MPIGGMFAGNSTVSGSQNLQSAAMTSAGGFVVAWWGNGSGDSVGIFSRQFRVNDFPTDIHLSSTIVDEGRPAGTVVGSISADDPNSGETFSFSLINGVGLDSTAFQIVGSSLRTAATFDVATKANYRIQIRATDNGGSGLSYDKQFVINVRNWFSSSAGHSASAVYTDDDGDSFTIKLTGAGSLGIALADFDGDGRGAIESLTVSGTNGSSRVAVQVRKGKQGDGLVTVGQFLGNGPLKSIDLRASDLVGAGLTINGGLGSLVVHDIRGGVLVRQAGAGVSTLTAHALQDNAQVDFDSRLTSLTAARIGAARIATPAIGRLKVSGDSRARLRGDMLADMTLTGPADATLPTLGKTTIAGDLADALWTIAGELESLSVTGSLRDWGLDVTARNLRDAQGDLLNSGDGGVGELAAARVFASQVNAARVIGSVVAKEWKGGGLNADSLNSLSIAGNFRGAVSLLGTEVAATAATLGKTTISGSVVGSSFIVQGNVSAFSALRFIDSKLWVGFIPTDPTVNPVVSPGSHTLAGHRLASFTTRDRGDSFRGSTIVADSLGKISLANVATDPALTPFGIAFGTNYAQIYVRGARIGANGAAYQANAFRVVQL